MRVCGGLIWLGPKMRGVILAVLLVVATSGHLSGNGVSAALQQQQRQEIDKQQLLSIDRPVNDHNDQNQKTIPGQTLAISSPAPFTDNGTQIIIQSSSKIAANGQPASSNASKQQQQQQVPTTSPSGANHHRQHPTQQQKAHTTSASSTPTAVVASSTTTTTTSSSTATSQTTTMSATALTGAASTISSIRAAPPPESGRLSKQHQSQQQNKRTPPNNSINNKQTKAPQAVQRVQRISNEINEPKASSKSRNANNNNNNNNNNNKQQEQSGELIDRMSTSHSVSFTDPAPTKQQQQPQFSKLEEEKQQQTQQQYKGSGSGSNRWTHFGARLKPLASSGDHYATATSTSKAQTAYQRQQLPQLGQTQNHHQQQQTQPRQPPASVRSLGADPTSSNNQLDDDEDSDDQDSEALLYKMLQQQNFLPAPNWQEGDMAGNEVQPTGRQTSPTSQLSAGNSKRVIKLLKSYSHIHQVDDSDDQIRGTNTRLYSHRRPATGGPQAGRALQSSTSNYLLRATHQNGRPQPPPSATNRRSRPSQDAARQTHSHHSDPEASKPTDNQIDDQPDEQANPDEPSSSEQGPSGAESGSDEEFECPNNGIFADEASNCQAYHVCQSGAQVQQRFQCPMGTLFNNLILTCDFAHNVQCGKKKPLPAAGADQQDTIYRQSPRATSTNQLQTTTSRQQQQSTLTNRPATQYKQQGAGPRQLTIGQKYNQDSSPLNGRAQTIGPQPGPGVLGYTNNGDEASEDDEPLLPLVPATLPTPARAPARPTAANPAQLPYNAPPARAKAHGHQQNYQSAHRSQFPSSRQNQRMMAHDDTASAVAPIFVNTDASLPPVGNNNLYAASDANMISNDQGQLSYNLVINHMAPTRLNTQQQLQQLQVPKLIGSGQQVVAENNLVSLVHSKQAANFQISKSQLQTQIPNLGNKIGLDTKPTGSLDKLAQPQQQQRPRTETKIKNQHQPNNYEIQRQQQQQRHHNQWAASQPKSTYATDGMKHQQQSASSTQQPKQQQLVSRMKPQQQQQIVQQRGSPLIDMTNDQSRSGISAEALNDGLLLLLRHGASADRGQMPLAKRAAKQRLPAASTSQAIAVDPGSISSNSPIDAQLFPNVQRLLNNKLPAFPGGGSDANLNSPEATQSHSIRHSSPPTYTSPSTDTLKVPNISTTTTQPLTEIASSTISFATTPANSQQQQLHVQNKTTNTPQQPEIHQTKKIETTKQQVQLQTDNQLKQQLKPKQTKRVKRLKTTQWPVSKTQEKSDLVRSSSGNVQQEDSIKKQTTRSKWLSGGSQKSEDVNKVKSHEKAEDNKQQRDKSIRA